MKKAQVSIEYLVIVGFITFLIIGVFAIALVYSGSVKDRIRVNQMIDSAQKIISTAEFVFYSGAPSKATLTVYFPDGIESVEIIGDSLVFIAHTSSGTTQMVFESKVPISGNLSYSKGLRKIEVLAQEGGVVLS